MADFNAGSIEARLELDRSAFTDGLQMAKDEADKFEKRKIKPKVDADVGEALGKFDDVEMRADELDKKKVTVKVDADTAQATKKIDQKMQDLHILSTAIIAGGSAAIPLAAVGAGAFAGLIGSAGVAVLAIEGIKNAMKQGTPIGQAYTAQISVLKTDLAGLEGVAASGLFNGVSKGIASIHSLMPTVTTDVKGLSAQLGDIVGHVAPGFVALFTKMNPLFQSFGTDLDHGATSFEAWARSSTGVSSFVAYVQQHLPEVEHTLGELITTASHLVQAFAPFGSTTLTALRLVSTAINDIPIGVLQTLVPLLAGLKIGSTLSAGISNAATQLGGFSTKLEGASGIASKASGFVSGVGKAVGFLGPVGLAAGLAMGGLSAIMGRNSQAAVEDQKHVNDLTQALQNGTATATIYTQLLGSGVLKAGQQVGLSSNTLIAAVTGQGAALTEVNHKVADLAATYKTLNTQVHVAAGNPMGGGASKSLIDQWNTAGTQLGALQGKLGDAEKDYVKAQKAAADFANSIGDSALASQITSGDYVAIAKSLGMTGDAYLNAKLTADQNTTSTAAATAAMQLENNAAGLLNQALNSLAGQNLSVAQAQTALDTSVLTGTATLKTNKSTINAHTKAGLDDQTAIEGMASALRAKATADAAAGVSTDSVTKKYQASAKAILDNIANLDGDKTAADKAKDATYQFAASILKIPKVASTEFDITARLSQIVITATAAGQSAHNAARGGYATGGWINGPGTATSDSILKAVSTGEFVVKAAAARMNGPLLEAINSGAIGGRTASRSAANMPQSNAGKFSSTPGGGSHLTASAIGQEVAGALAPVLAQQTNRAHQFAKQRAVQGVGYGS